MAMRPYEEYPNSNVESRQGLMARDDPHPSKPVFLKNFQEQSIIAEWLAALSWKMQTIALEMLRGPDTHYAPTVKKLARWCRVQLIKNADPKTSFMKKGVNNNLSLDAISDELEFCTGHYIAHFVQMLSCIAYFHPNVEIKLKAMHYYKHIVEHDLHLNIETKEQMIKRLSDNKMERI